MAENKKVPLHKPEFTISFKPDDEIGAELVPWMCRVIDSAGLNYEQEKKTLFESVGYETGWGTGKVTFSGTSWDDLLGNFLGVGDGLAVKDFSFTPSSFWN